MSSTEQTFSVSRVWSILRRRAIPAGIAFGVVALSAIVAAIAWPPSYSSTGTILIEQQELPSDLVRSTISTYASQRVQIITQRVMTTENLLGIIDRYKLYADLRRRKPREEVIAEMRKAVHLQMISADVIDPRSGSPIKATIAFSLTYTNRSPEVAAQVANELVSLYLQQNIEQRQKSAQDAVTFLGGERARLSKEIDALQGRLATFKAQHANELPELSQLNLTNLNRYEDEVRETDARIQSNAQQLLYIDSQLALINPTAQIYSSTGERVQSPQDLLKQFRSEYARATALYAPDHPDVVRLKREIAGLEAGLAVSPSDASKLAQDTLNDHQRQLQDALTQLAAAKEHYAPDHPDVVRLQKLVDSLQQQATAVPDAATASVAASTPDPGADNPPYVQLRTQRETLVSERASLQDTRASLSKKRDEFEAHLARTPAVEREYTELLRDISTAQGQFADIGRKQMEADVSNNLETERKGERFNLIEPPLAAEEPTSPNRPLILIFGLLAALACLGGTVATLEALDSTVRGRADLLQLISVPPLAIIPVMLTHADHVLLRRRRRYAAYGAAGGAVLAVLAVHWFFRPLDVVWAVALRHLGVSG